jgi:type IV pilus assembly protein PilQ
MQDQAATASRSNRTYTGNPVSLDFQQADLRAVLRVFSEISGLNIVIDPAVRGTVDVALRDVPWDQALDIILRANKLGYMVDGTVVRIAPLTTLAEEENQRRKLAEEQALSGDLHVLTRTLSYARAEELQALLTKSVLSKRGSVQVDPRTNTLIITDLQDALDAAANLITTLDTAQPQVEIEARIVQTSKSFARALGVQWGATGRVDPALGNTTNLAFPNSGTISGPLGGSMVNLPAKGAATSGVGLALG